ncbi:MAG TPA: hypothetical protein DHV36_01955 [Desulfobacteraceae bacterium]|nr:hypothetical protein [Desulfobacteraceae bacterium]
MPINIFQDNSDRTQIDWICDGDWDLSSQIYKFENWLIRNEEYLKEGPYVADIGFRPRRDASGGGGVISLNMLEILNKIKMELFLSEYPGDVD